MTKISIIVPVYGVEKYIGKCIESILSQTFDDFECLLVNDGTKDNSIEVAKSVFGNDERFKVLNKENGGLSDARNFGLKHAIGEYVFFLDSDDTIDKECLELTYKEAIKNDSDICVFDMLYVYDDGRESSYSSGGYFDVTSYINDKDLIYINNSANNKLFRKKFLEDKQFIKGMWYEDLAVIPVWLAKANNVSHVKKPLYHYLQRTGSISHSADPRIFDIYKAINMVKESLDLLSDDVSTLYLNNCLVMTTLRIRDIEENKTRVSYYRHNVELLDINYPGWYKETKKRDYTFKQKIVFFMLKNHLIGILDKIY